MTPGLSESFQTIPYQNPPTFFHPTEHTSQHQSTSLQPVTYVPLPSELRLLQGAIGLHRAGRHRPDPRVRAAHSRRETHRGLQTPLNYPKPR